MSPRSNLGAEAGRLELTYRLRIGGGEWADVAESVRIVHAPCRFGGERPYFICPRVVNGIACGRRVAKLHGQGRYFVCRHCYRLAHASQGEGVWDRGLRRANKIRQRLGGDPGMAAPFPERPKGMWQRTYVRLRDKAFDAEMRAEAGFVIRATQLLARIETKVEFLAMSETKPMSLAEAGGTEITRFNALKHGVLSQYTVLPWEDPDEYRALVGALAAEHAPQGPTEEHLVEELAGILWRKRRLRLAEAATFHRGLEDTFSPYGGTMKAALAYVGASNQSEGVSDVVQATATATEEEMADIAAAEAMTHHALELLHTTRNDAYRAALAALPKDTQEWWADMLVHPTDELEEGEQPSTADAEGLRGFLENEALPWFERRKLELANRPLIRDQAFGEALDPDKLERLGRYEVHLDRKLERMLAMLLRLKELRQRGVES